VEAFVPIDDAEARAEIDEILGITLADDRRSWLLSPDGRWQRTERLTGFPGTIDAQQLLKVRAAERSQAAVLPHRAHAGLGSLEPWA
jgi:polyphosphate kinase